MDEMNFGVVQTSMLKPLFQVVKGLFKLVTEIMILALSLFMGVRHGWWCCTFGDDGN